MFTFNHFNFNVLDLDRSLEFYDKALGLKPVRENHGDNFTLVYLGDGKTDFQLELTYCIIFVNEGMGIYFIEDPDGYWIEIIPAK